MVFTGPELEYLRSQRLGRLATVGPDGAPQNNPVGFNVDAETGTIEIGGWNLGESRKFRNIESNPQVAFVVDHLESMSPWQVRGVQVRGTAEALRNQRGAGSGVSSEVTRIHPRRVQRWGLGEGGKEGSRRTVPESVV
ncbi:MAG: PPOX class F420-dependent oxidoreductase [Candidatus Dormibacteria bacterium]